MKSTKNSDSIDNISVEKEPSKYSKYGNYMIDEKLELFFPKTTVLILRSNDGKFLYKRTNSENEIIQKIIATNSKSFEIQVVPLLPLHLPSYKTDYLFLRFSDQIFISKNCSTEIHLPFPVEIGIFTTIDSIDLIDFFTCESFHSHFGLYGPPEEGKLCKYAKIPVQYNKDEPFVYAQMKVKVLNELERGISLGRIVLPATDLDLYYNDKSAIVDNLKLILKNRGGLEIAEIAPDRVMSSKGWAKSPRDIEKTNFTFAMEKGFD